MPTIANRWPATYCRSFALIEQPAKVLAKCLLDYCQLLPNFAGMICMVYNLQLGHC